MMLLVTGASASGKSRWAENRLMEFGGERVYAATMIPWDAECRERIKRHRKMREKKQFVTVECPLDLKKLDGIQGKDVLLECLSNLTANEMYREDKEAVSGTPEQRILDGILKIRREAANLVVVTNEVFSDGETYSEETKEYMERLGRLNRDIAALADEAVEVVCGIPVFLKRAERRNGP